MEWAVENLVPKGSLTESTRQCTTVDSLVYSCQPLLSTSGMGVQVRQKVKDLILLMVDGRSLTTDSIGTCSACLTIKAALHAVPDVPMWYYTAPENMFYIADPRIRYVETHVRTKTAYNHILRRVDFWRAIPAEFVLLFERDTIFCHRPAHRIAYFLRAMKTEGIAYLGALWPDTAWWCKTKGYCVGNSGLSLWNVNTTTALVDNRNDNQNIDFYMHRQVVRRKMPLPSSSFASLFSQELTSGNKTFRPFGCHEFQCCR